MQKNNGKQMVYRKRNGRTNVVKYVMITALIVSILIVIIVCMNFIHKSENSHNAEKLDNNSVKKDINGSVNPLEDIPFSDEEEKSIRNQITKVTNEYAESYTTRESAAEILGKKGYTVCLDFYDGSIINYEKFDEYCKNMTEKLGDKADIYYIQNDGGLLWYHFECEDGQAVLTAATSDISDGVKVPYMTKYQLYSYCYTDRGILFTEKYVPEGSEMDGHIAIRVRPENAEYKELCDKYIRNIGYDLNNLFITNWNENDMSVVDFNDLFETMYYFDRGTEVEHDMYTDGIPSLDYEGLFMKYFNVTSDTLRLHGKYDEITGLYPWARVGCMTYSPDISGSPMPEVVGSRDNGDGTITLTVDAVWEWFNTQKAFEHELTVRVAEDGNYKYVSNKVIQSDNNIMPQYKHRFVEGW